MASTHETHSGVAGVTTHGQLRTLHRATDDGAAATPRTTGARPAPPREEPVRSITRGEAEGPTTGPGSNRPAARKRQSHPPRPETPKGANRVFVFGSDGRPLMPCTMRRARMLIDAGRVSRRDYNPFTIHLKDRAADDGKTAVQPVEVRCTPGARHTGIAVVATLDGEDRVLYQEEVQHRTDISHRLAERRAHRQRRRSTKWYRPRRFNNRRRDGWLPPSIESIIANQHHRLQRLASRSGASEVTVQTGKFDTHRILNPDVEGTGYQHGPLYRRHLRAFIAEQWNHRCTYCGKGDWEDATRFNLDHVVPRTAGGADNVRNLVWSCRPCNQLKGERPVEAFLRENPERLTAVLRARKAPLAAAGQHAAICKVLMQRLKAGGLKTTETTGADTAHNARRQRHQEVARERCSVLPGTRTADPAATTGRTQEHRPRTAETDQEPAGGTVPDMATPNAIGTPGNAVSRARATPQPCARHPKQGPRAGAVQEPVDTRRGRSSSCKRANLRTNENAHREHDESHAGQEDCPGQRIPNKRSTNANLTTTHLERSETSGDRPQRPRPGSERPLGRPQKENGRALREPKSVPSSGVAKRSRLGRADRPSRRRPENRCTGAQGGSSAGDARNVTGSASEAIAGL